MFLEHIFTTFSFTLLGIIRGCAAYIHPYEELKQLGWVYKVVGIISFDKKTMSGPDIAIFSFYIIAVVMIVTSLVFVYLRTPGRKLSIETANLITQYNYSNEFKALEEAYAETEENEYTTREAEEDEDIYAALLDIRMYLEREPNCSD